MKDQTIKRINLVYLATVLVSCIAPYLGISYLTENYLILLLASQVLLILPTAVYFIVTKADFKETVRLNKIKVTTGILLIILTFLIMPLLTLINAVSMLFATNSTADYMQNIVEQSPMLLGVLGVAVVPAFLEESVYRGIFYNEYRKVKPIAAIFLSALLFAMLHGNFNQFSYAFVMGAIFALVIEATNSILSTMIIHFIVNANSIVMLYALPKLVWYLNGLYKNAELLGNTEQMEMIKEFFGGDGMDLDSLLASSDAALEGMGLLDVLGLYGVQAVVCTILAFFVYRLIAMSNGQWDRIRAMFRKQKPVKEETPAPEKSGKKQRLVTIPLIIGLAIMLVGMIVAELP